MIYDSVTGRRRVLHALIFTAVYSRHMFVWLSFAQTLEAVVAGCEAAWCFFGGVFKVLIPDNMKPVVAQADAVNRSSRWVGWSTRRRVVSPPTPLGSAHPRTSPGWNGWCSMCAEISLPVRNSSI